MVPINLSNSFKVKTAGPEDIKGVASAHVSAFQGKFLTKLGSKSLESYYDFFRDHPLGILLIAKEDENQRAIGFICGWQKGAAYQNYLIQRCGTRFSMGLLNFVIREPLKAAELIRPRLKLIYALGRSWLMPRIKQSRLNNVQDATKYIKISMNASLLSIGVVPGFQKYGVGQKLHNAFIKKCKARNINEIWLSVETNNSKAISFYEKLGWSLFHQKNNLHYRIFLDNYDFVKKF